MHFSFEFLLLMAFEMKWKFSYFSHFSMVGRGGTLTALRQHMIRRTINLKLWHELYYIELHYAFWHWRAMLSLASCVGLKVEIYKKALEGQNVQKFHSRRVLRTI